MQRLIDHSSSVERKLEAVNKKLKELNAAIDVVRQEDSTSVATCYYLLRKMYKDKLQLEYDKRECMSKSRALKEVHKIINHWYTEGLEATFRKAAEGDSSCVLLYENATPELDCFEARDSMHRYLVEVVGVCEESIKIDGHCVFLVMKS
jgi:hypothetical protein